jgi:hypothetical protein
MYPKRGWGPVAVEGKRCHSNENNVENLEEVKNAIREREDAVKRKKGRSVRVEEAGPQPPFYWLDSTNSHEQRASAVRSQLSAEYRRLLLFAGLLLLSLLFIPFFYTSILAPVDPWNGSAAICTCSHVILYTSSRISIDMSYERD